MLIFELLKNIYKPFLIAACAIVIFSLILTYMPEGLAVELVDEDGTVETAQVALYLIAAMVCFVYKVRKIWDGGLSAGFIMTVFALRELDFQLKFTEISVTRTKYYFSPDVSFDAKILAGFIVISIILIIISFAWKNFINLINGVKNNKIWAILTMNGIIFTFLSMLIDMSLRGLEINKRREIVKSFFEEMTELAIPVFFLTALITYGISCLQNQKNAGR